MSFPTKYPSIELELVDGTSSRLEEALVRGVIDAAFLSLPLQDPQLAFEGLFEKEVLISVQAAHPVCATAKTVEGFGYPWIDIADLRGDNFILIKRGQRVRRFSD